VWEGELQPLQQPAGAQKAVCLVVAWPLSEGQQQWAVGPERWRAETDAKLGPGWLHEPWRVVGWKCLWG